MRFGNFVQSENLGVQWFDMRFIDQIKHRVNGRHCREIGEKAREEHAVGDVLDGVEMLHGEDVSEDARVADVAWPCNATQTIL